MIICALLCRNLATIFFSFNGTFFCNEVKIASEKKFIIEQHISHTKHKNAIERKNVNQNLSFLSMSSIKSTFNYNLCQSLLLASIPLKYQID